MNRLALDLLIFGGGVAGLWALLQARRAGYRVLLLESQALGGVQSIASQGIIHGGTKYALKGKLTAATQAISDMPGIWADALAGNGSMDLSAVRVISPHQYLWSSGSLSSSLASVFASKLMQSKVQAMAKSQLPAPFDASGFRGSLYQLQEPVLDTASLMSELAKQALPQCYHYSPQQMKIGAEGVQIKDYLLQPRQILLAAGEGNAALMERWNMDVPQMQTRPLHMVMVKGLLPPVFAHCLGASSNPRLTITSYPLAEGQIWYLGGQLAEEGVKRSEQAQLAYAKSELEKLLPWMKFDHLQWSSLRINRAEKASAGGKRPNDCHLSTHGDVMVAWPTKLAFAPRLAEQVLLQLKNSPAQSGDLDAPSLELPKPELATLPWEQVSTWN